MVGNKISVMFEDTGDPETVAVTVKTAVSIWLGEVVVMVGAAVVPLVMLIELPE